MANRRETLSWPQLATKIPVFSHSRPRRGAGGGKARLLAAGNDLDVITRPAAFLVTGRRIDRLPRVSRLGTVYSRKSIRIEFCFQRNAPARIAGAATSLAQRSRCLASPPDRSGSNKRVAGHDKSKPHRAVAWRHFVLSDDACRDHRAARTLSFLWRFEANWLAACDPRVEGECGSKTNSPG